MSLPAVATKLVALTSRKSAVIDDAATGLKANAAARLDAIAIERDVATAAQSGVGSRHNGTVDSDGPIASVQTDSIARGQSRTNRPISLKSNRWS